LDMEHDDRKGRNCSWQFKRREHPLTQDYGRFSKKRKIKMAKKRSLQRGELLLLNVTEREGCCGKKMRLNYI